MTSREPMKCLPRSEFEQQFSPAVNASGSVKRFYKGFKNIEDVKKFRSGVPVIKKTDVGCYFDGVYGGCYGHFITVYSTKRVGFDHAYGSEFKRNDDIGLYWDVVTSAGEVAEMAVDTSNLKYISADRLDKIIATLLYYNPEIGNAYEYFDRGYSWFKIKRFLGLDYYFKVREKVFKQIFGFDLNDLAEKLKPDYRSLEKEEQDKFRYKFSSFVDDELKKFPEFIGEIYNIFRQGDVKPYFVDKRCAALVDRGLIAKLLGYDALVLLVLNDEKNVISDFDMLHIVNAGVLTVCAENNPDLAILMEATTENLKKIFNEINF